MDGRIHVLVVDSDVEFSTRICEILDKTTEYDYRVSASHSGQEALTNCRWQKYDCVLVDFVLPDISGIQMIKELCDILDEQTSPIVVMAAENIREAAMQSVKFQAADFIMKSDVNHQSIRRSINNAVDKAQLQRGIRERRRELLLANKELERQSIEIQNFYQTVSHEIKTPLSAAREFLSIVHDEVLGPINAQQAEVLNHATICCDQITTQFNDLVDLTRLETGKLALDITSLRLDDVINRVLAMVATSAEEKSIILDSRLPEMLPMVDFDAGRITQVLSNLLNNAIKFTQNGGRVRLSVKQLDNGLIQLKVSDNGRGIAKDHVESVFDRLFQVEAAHQSGSQSGLGIGLSIAREIVRGHGHQLRVRSRLNGGSAFTFELEPSMQVEKESVQKKYSA